MLDHIYENSISDLLCKLLTQIKTGQNVELKAQVKQKKEEIIRSLVNKLSAESSYEVILSSSQALQELALDKKLLIMICKRENISTIIDNSAKGLDEGCKESKIESLKILNTVLSNLSVRSSAS